MVNKECQLAKIGSKITKKNKFREHTSKLDHFVLYKCFFLNVSTQTAQPVQEGLIRNQLFSYNQVHQKWKLKQGEGEFLLTLGSLNTIENKKRHNLYACLPDYFEQIRVEQVFPTSSSGTASAT